MWEIWANKLFPNALKSCLKFNKLPNLVTLDSTEHYLSLSMGHYFSSGIDGYEILLFLF